MLKYIITFFVGVLTTLSFIFKKKADSNKINEQNIKKMKMQLENIKINELSDEEKEKLLND